uniref:Putative ferric-chelate reductase 1 n=1 Tax=Pelodiscus sinensis TaxID=13735 RepID=K7G745_PELSI
SFCKEACINILLLAVRSISIVLGFPSGNISPACDSMLPVHDNSVSQTTSAPYKISISNTSFDPGNKITVTLQTIDNSSFEGFLLQARAVRGNSIVGTFQIIDPNTQGLLCNQLENSSVSHTSSSRKQYVTAVWVAPSGTGNVQFRATVVQHFKVFWTDVRSQTLLSSSSPTNLLSPLEGATAPCLTEPDDYLLTSTSGREGCGTQKFCFSSPPGCNLNDPNCYFMSSEAQGGDAFKFEMSGLSDGYVAIGFSDDTEMGNDDIYICGKNATGQIEVQHAFSTGQTAPNILPLGDVQITMTSFNSGKISCSFITRNAISTQLKAASSLYFIFLAHGPSTAGQIYIHSRTPFITPRKVNISSYEAVGATDSSHSIIKAHEGALMLIAWMTTGSLGMIFAKYLKNVINTTLLGKDIWFQIHLFLMVITVAETIAAFVLAFVEEMGWNSWDTSDHGIIGCIVMILSFFQPVIACFRPSPYTNRRFIFNWFHALNALVIKVLAVAAIFLGLQLFDTSPSLWMVKTMGGFVGWEALAYIMLDANAWLKKKDQLIDSLDCYQVLVSKTDVQIEFNLIKNEIIIFLIYTCGNLAFVIALLVGIGKS